MSEKTIEICSIHTGDILVSIPGEPKARTIHFEPRDDTAKQRTIGVALCDDLEAEVLLGKIGAPSYFKAQNEFGSISVTSAPDAKKVSTLSAEAYGKLNVEGVKVAAKECLSVDEIKEMIVMETNGQNRTGAQKALEARLLELVKVNEPAAVGLTAENFNTLESEALLAAIKGCADSDLLRDLLAVATQAQNPVAETIEALDARLEELVSEP